MLAPVTEADFGEQAALALGLAARERWPAFAARLEEETGRPTGFRESGALVVAADRDDVEELRRLHELHVLARARLRMAAALALPAARAVALAADRGRHARRGRRPGGPARDRARARRRPWSEIAFDFDVGAIEHDGERVTGVTGPARHDRLRPRGGGGRCVVARARPGAGAAGAARQGPDPRAARPRRRRRAARADRAHPALLPGGPRRRARGARGDDGGAGLRHRGHRGRRAPAARARLGGAARDRRARAGAAPWPGCGPARRTTCR